VAPIHFEGDGYLRIAAAPYNTGDDYDRLAAAVAALLDRRDPDRVRRLGPGPCPAVRTRTVPGG
jgi:hypothetical protein